MAWVFFGTWVTCCRTHCTFNQIMAPISPLSSGSKLTGCLGVTLGLYQPQRAYSCHPQSWSVASHFWSLPISCPGLRLHGQHSASILLSWKRQGHSLKCPLLSTACPKHPLVHSSHPTRAGSKSRNLMTTPSLASVA